MKIKEFLIMRYGPLGNTGRALLHNFNLFFGKNEYGKTLMIDALVKLLLGRNIRGFEGIDRVEETPVGYVILLDDKGKEIKLPEKGDLTKVANLTSSECCNIFIVRNSNLSIGRGVTQEGEFYTNVVDRLTGLRTNDISIIKKKLQELGKLTRPDSRADLSDSKDYENIKSRWNKATKLIEEIDSLQDKVKAERFDELEEESAKQRQKIERIEQEIRDFEDARKRENYEKGKEALDNLKKSLKNLMGLEIYNEKDKELWRDCDSATEKYREDKEKLFEELQKNEEELKKISEKLNELEKDFLAFDNRKNELDKKIRGELDNYKTKSRELTEQDGKNKFFTSIGIISTILFGISLFGAIFTASLLFYILVILFLISAIVSAVFKFKFVKNKASLAGMFENIKLTLSKFGLDAENIEGIFSNIQKFDEYYRKKNNELQEIKRKKDNLEEKINELRDKRIRDIENKIENAKEKIYKIKINSGEDSLEGYTKKLKLKQELEGLIREQRSILKSQLGEKSEKLEENISYWDEEIKKLEEYKNKARDIKYNETKKSELEKEKEKLKEELENLNKGSIQKEMEDIEQKANDILRLGEYLYCKTSVDLEATKTKLQGFIDEIESEKDNALNAIKIFEEIEVEEKEKVSELFGKESPISKYFNEITEGLYEEVNFNQEIGKIEVKRKDAVLEAEKLSGGAYDQLYFSIRLALGEKLLKGKKGFFIMDDPFIKADPYRLQRQIKMLKKLSELGWQVIYFSAKGEIRYVLEEDINKGAINYVEVHGIFS